MGNGAGQGPQESGGHSCLSSSLLLHLNSGPCHVAPGCQALSLLVDSLGSGPPSRNVNSYAFYPGDF